MLNLSSAIDKSGFFKEEFCVKVMLNMNSEVSKMKKKISPSIMYVDFFKLDNYIKEFEKIFKN